MTTTPFVQVAGVGLWMPGYPSATAWVRGERDDSSPKPTGDLLGRRNRRRASQFGRALADASDQALSSADVDPATVSLVVGSAIAEATTLIGLLDQIWRGEEPVSPAAFSMSVHNAASGLISIAAQNRGFATSLAAECDTPASALMEAIGLVLTTGDPALVACADETVPRGLLADFESWDPLSAAVVLLPDGQRDSVLARLRLREPGPATLPGAALDERLARNPQAGLADLVDALLRGQSGTLRLDRGAGRGARAELTPVDAPA